MMSTPRTSWMSPTTGVRLLVGLGGVVVAAIGARDLLEQEWADLVNIVTWLAGGVVIHDALLAPVVVLAGVVLVRLLPSWARMPVVTGLVVLGTVSMVAFPMISRFGAAADNPSLLPRDYTAGWFVFAALVVAGTAMAMLLSWRRTQVAAAGPARPAAQDDDSEESV